MMHLAGLCGFSVALPPYRSQRRSQVAVDAWRQIEIFVVLENIVGKADDLRVGIRYFSCVVLESKLDHGAQSGNDVIAHRGRAYDIVDCSREIVTERSATHEHEVFLEHESLIGEFFRNLLASLTQKIPDRVLPVKIFRDRIDLLNRG